MVNDKALGIDYPILNVILSEDTDYDDSESEHEMSFATNDAIDTLLRDEFNTSLVSARMVSQFL